jgi:polysaccharide biosynthesis/export protein
MTGDRNKGLALALFSLVMAVGGTGCHSVPMQAEPIPDLQLPKELNMVTMPAITVEAPDILLIDTLRTIPLPPYKVQPLDALYLNDEKSGDPEEFLQGIYPVEYDGTVNLGPTYGGSFKVADLTIPEIQKRMTAYLQQNHFKNMKVIVNLAASRANQQIAGQHLVRPDGTVGLGSYGSVYVAGMTLPQVRAAIEQHLSRFLYKPEVSVDVYAFNSKFYYVITDFAGSGEQVQRLPVTGNEKVLDAIAQIGGLSPVSSKKIWVARPAPAGTVDQILPVDWKGITRRGHARTNYQILPGDRVFVMSQPVTKFNTFLGRSLDPIERALGTSLLGFTTFKTFETSGQVGLFGGGGGN